jgi:hypothetical protein
VIHLLALYDVCRLTGKLENCLNNAGLRPENWSEMVSMCANVFSTQGKSLFDDFMKMTPHIVETYFEPTNCTNYTSERTYRRQNGLTPIKNNGTWNASRSNGKQKPSLGQNFNKCFPRRSAPFSVLPNIGTHYEEISFESLQIGPQLYIYFLYKKKVHFDNFLHFFQSLQKFFCKYN